MTKRTTGHIIQSIWDRFAGKPRRDSASFLRKCKGVIHVGANSGQEREVYEHYDLDVLWIEPIPEVFQKLKTNIAPFGKQKGVCALVSDEDDREILFNVSSNEGQSSSMLDLAAHKELWPEVNYTHTLKLKSVTLPTLLRRERIDPAFYDALVLDTQGSELLVLKGAGAILKGFQFISSEAADFEAYKGCCKLEDLDQFLIQRGFKRAQKESFASKEGTGSYFNALYERESNST